MLVMQLDYLYQKYQIESNPSRKMLETIAREVGLKKRVVQVWFQVHKYIQFNHVSHFPIISIMSKFLCKATVVSNGLFL